MSFSDILTYLTGGEDPITTVSEIAVVMSRDPQTVYGYRQGNSIPDFNAVRALNRWLVEEKGCYIILNQMLPEVGGRSNGKVTDDLMGIWEAGTDLHRAFPHDKNGCRSALGRIEAETKDLEAEVESL